MQQSPSLLAGEELDHEIKRPFINQITKKGPFRDAIKAAIKDYRDKHLSGENKAAE